MVFLGTYILGLLCIIQQAHGSLAWSANGVKGWSGIKSHPIQAHGRQYC